MKKKLAAFVPMLGGAALAARRLRRREPYDFRDNVVLITGGSRGLGLVLARQFAAEGARIAIIARHAPELERARQDLEERGADVLAFQCDVRDREQAQGAVERVVDHFGAIDVLVNNAGVIVTGPVEHMTIEDFQEGLADHTLGPLYTIMAAAAHMRRQGGGRIVNITSIGGSVAVPHLAAYCMSKFAAVGLSDSVRAELAKDNIKVTTVRPGLMRTGSPFNAYFKGQHRQEFTLFVIISSVPLITIDARRAAHQIVEACRRGDRELTMTLAARVLELANMLFPNLVGGVMASIVRLLLPGPTDEQGDIEKTGWESRTRLAPSPLTHFTNEAALRNNEVGAHQPPA